MAPPHPPRHPGSACVAIRDASDYRVAAADGAVSAAVEYGAAFRAPCPVAACLAIRGAGDYRVQQPMAPSPPQLHAASLSRHPAPSLPAWPPVVPATTKSHQQMAPPAPLPYAAPPTGHPAMLLAAPAPMAPLATESRRPMAPPPPQTCTALPTGCPALTPSAVPPSAGLPLCRRRRATARWSASCATSWAATVFRRMTGYLQHHLPRDCLLRRQRSRSRLCRLWRCLLGRKALVAAHLVSRSVLCVSVASRWLQPHLLRFPFRWLLWKTLFAFGSIMFVRLQRCLYHISNFSSFGHLRVRHFRIGFTALANFGLPIVLRPAPITTSLNNNTWHFA